MIGQAMSTVKLGSKVDGFERKGRAWFVATELQSDIVVEVKDVKFFLHKFPLLSRSGLLNRLVFESRDTQKNQIQLEEIPGGPEAFELAAKFCYGMAVDLNATNVAAIWCAAVYLEMTESLEEGNLLSKAEAFFNLVVLGSWKDSVTVLQSCEQLFPWSERLQIVQRCTESIAWKACTDPRGIKSPFTGSRLCSRTQSPSSAGRSSPDHDNVKRQLMKDWWFDDVLVLPIQLFLKVVEAIRVKGMRAELVAAVVAFYAVKWLPRKSDFSQTIAAEDLTLLQNRSRLLLEHILGALPRGKDVVPSKVLMYLIRTAYLVEAEASCKVDLEQRAGLQLDSSTLNDLVIPASTASGDRVDVDLFRRILQHYLRQQDAGGNCQSTNAGKIRVGNLVDGYLADISKDQRFSVAEFLALAEAFPHGWRSSHDALYKAVDNFLKAHPDLRDEDRKNICKILDCKKLSLKSCMHAAQNERLPLRTVMQVLFFEQLKMSAKAAAGAEYLDQLPTFEKPVPFEASQNSCAALQEEMQKIRCELERMKAEFAEFQSNFYYCGGSAQPLELAKGKSDVASRLKKLGRSFQSLSAGLPPAGAAHAAGPRSTSGLNKRSGQRWGLLR